MAAEQIADPGLPAGAQEVPNNAPVIYLFLLKKRNKQTYSCGLISLIPADRNFKQTQLMFVGLNYQALFSLTQAVFLFLFQ